MVLHEYRVSLGINQTILGERLGVTQETISRWEKFGPPDHIIRRLKLSGALKKLKPRNARLSKIMRAHRKLLNITQEELAEVIGVDITSISRIERGLSDPSAKTTQRIMSVIDVPQINRKAISRVLRLTTSPVVVTNRKGEILEMNSALKNILCPWRKEIRVGKSWFNFFPASIRVDLLGAGIRSPLDIGPRRSLLIAGKFGSTRIRVEAFNTPDTEEVAIVIADSFKVEPEETALKIVRR
ncbi:MAG: hypothetical protein COA62_15730 [Rhodobiaceae bacterium]|nr:MAG: hypothetical protein COA62_15730 [Rhodobiaceae bacterium]